MIWRISLTFMLLAVIVTASGAGLDIRLLLNGGPLEKTTGSPTLAGKPLRIGFQILSGEEGTPISDLHPGAWIRPRAEGRKSCGDAVRNYLAQGPNASQDISLNGYTFITLNQDQTVAVMDPRLNLATSNLLSLTRLQGAAVDWRIAPSREVLYVALNHSRRLVVIDPVTGLVTARIPLADEPVQLAVFDRQALVWVAGNHGALWVVDPKKGAVVERFEVGEGRVFLASDRGNRRLFAYAQGDGNWNSIDVDSRRAMIKGQEASGSMGLDYSPLADRLYLALPDRRSLLAMFPANSPKPATITLGIGADRVHVSPDGRWLLATDGKLGTVSVVDTATETMTHGLQFKHPFDQVVFSDNYAYLRHTDIARVSLIHLPSLKRGVEPGVIEVPFGAKAPDVIGELPPLQAIVPLPEGGGAVVANPADRTLFLYMEDGMRAPMNAFRSWTAPPLAVLIHDRSLQETRPGLYETVSMIPGPGPYEVVFYLSNPPLTHCWPLDIAGKRVASTHTDPSLLTRVEIPSGNMIAGQPVDFEIGIPAAGDIPAQTDDLKVLLFRPGSSWQYRAFAKALGQGRYHVTVTFPRPGKYKLALQSQRLGLKIGQGKLMTIEVVSP